MKKFAKAMTIVGSLITAFVNFCIRPAQFISPHLRSRLLRVGSRLRANCARCGKDWT
jgi:hypothetical protein